MEAFILFTIIVMIIGLIRVYNTYPQSKNTHKNANEEEAGYMWFPGDSGGDSGGDGFDGGGADGDGGSSTHF